MTPVESPINIQQVKKRQLQTRLVHPNGLPPELDLIHNLAAIFCVLFR
jgi:hypothetical protein